MEENFNMRKIHAGYVVEFRNGQRALAMRYPRLASRLPRFVTRSHSTRI